MESERKRLREQRSASVYSDTGARWHAYRREGGRGVKRGEPSEPRGVEPLRTVGMMSSSLKSTTKLTIPLRKYAETAISLPILIPKTSNEKLSQSHRVIEL